MLLSHKLFCHSILCSAQVWDFLRRVDATGALGRAARSTPRLALRLLQRVRNFSAAPPAVTTADVNLTLERLAIDVDGLDEFDRRCL